MINTNKIVLFLCCLFGFSLPTFADTIPEAQPFLLCPKTVECDSTTIRTCRLSDNPYDIWMKPTYQGQKLIKGTYKLKEVVPSFSMPGWPVCKYFISENQPSPIMVTMEYDSERKYNHLNQFAPFASELSKWITNDGRVVKCLSEDPNLCPMVEVPEIANLNGGNSRFYYPNPNADWEHNYIVRWRLSYEELHDLCGSTSNCVIDVGNCDPTGDQCSHLGAVVLDISEPFKVKIDHIDTDESTLASCTLKKKQPFNTIFCEPNKK